MARILRLAIQFAPASSGEGLGATEVPGPGPAGLVLDGAPGAGGWTPCSGKNSTARTS